MRLLVGKKIFKARKKLGLTRAELGKLVDLHETTVKRYEDGKIKNLSIDKLKEFAKVLNEPPEYFMDWGAYRPSYASYIEESQFQYKTKPTTTILNVYGKICAGNGKLVYEDVIDVIICPYPRAKGEIIALQVDGESMNKVTPNGVYSIIKLQTDLENGQIAAVMIDKENAMLKKFYKLDDETIVLKPENNDNDFKAMTFMGSDINKLKIIGKYIGHVTPYKE